ncbi:MAG: hypothetical protein PHD02_04680 [Bacilli bacterium]|nr:hypothetical protein [Bacilli bacterium]
MELKKEELMNIVGGFSITASFISAVAKGINSILELGRSLGTAIRRIAGNSICSI